jgi:ACS family hexuronate transporter-like MFS transporter
LRKEEVASRTEPTGVDAVAPPSSAPEIANAAATSTLATRVGNCRWVICALLFFATTINYVDRQVLSILEKDLRSSIGWNDIQYSHIVLAFQAAYAVGLLMAGRLMDKLGSRIGYTLAIVLWSVAAISHSLARTVIGFSVARLALGLGEGGNFPAAIKTTSEWFPKKERALATGIFNAGTNIGAIVAPLTVPWIAIHYGWQWAFIMTGLLGFIWVVFWLGLYHRPQEHPRISKEELAHIQSDPADPPARMKWLSLVPHRQTWAFAVGKFLTDPIWWFYLFWIPSFLRDKHGLDLSTIGPPVIAIYLIADVGSVGGGLLSSTMIRRGWSVNRGRKTAMLICAICVVPIVFTPMVSSLWGVVALIGLAAAAHQGWSANIFTLASDMFPRKAVGSVVGLGGMAGAIGGMLIAEVTGRVLQFTGSYKPIFIIAGSAYLAAFLIVQALAPTAQMATIGERDFEDWLAVWRRRIIAAGSFLKAKFSSLTTRR